MTAVFITLECTLEVYVVSVTEQHYVSIFFTRLWSVRKPFLFRYMGRLVTNQQKCHFSHGSASFFFAVCFFGILVFIRMRSWIKKQRFAHRPKTSEKYCNVVFFCYANFCSKNILLDWFFWMTKIFRLQWSAMEWA